MLTLHPPHHYQRDLPLCKTSFRSSRSRASKPFVSVSAKLRAARVRTCTRDTFSRSFMFDPVGNQLLQVRLAELPADHISDGSVQAELLR